MTGLEKSHGRDGDHQSKNQRSDEQNPERKGYRPIARETELNSRRVQDEDVEKKNDRRDTEDEQNDLLQCSHGNAFLTAYSLRSEPRRRIGMKPGQRPLPATHGSRA